MTKIISIIAVLSAFATIACGDDPSTREKYPDGDVYVGGASAEPATTSTTTNLDTNTNVGGATSGENVGGSESTGSDAPYVLTEDEKKDLGLNTTETCELIHFNEHEDSYSFTKDIGVQDPLYTDLITSCIHHEAYYLRYLSIYCNGFESSFTTNQTTGTQFYRNHEDLIKQITCLPVTVKVYGYEDKNGFCCSM
jgi:hypothetical protein